MHGIQVVKMRGNSNLVPGIYRLRIVQSGMEASHTFVKQP